MFAPSLMSVRSAASQPSVLARASDAFDSAAVAASEVPPAACCMSCCTSISYAFPAEEDLVGSASASWRKYSGLARSVHCAGGLRTPRRASTSRFEQMP